MSWDGLTAWWMKELGSDPAYEELVTPLVMELLDPVSGERILDVGCGEGRVMQAVASRDAVPVGVDKDKGLLGLAVTSGPVVRSELPRLPMADSAFDAAYISLVLEHLEDHRPTLVSIERVLRPGGRLVAVLNHPMFTAPDSAPIVDDDGEMLWRPGRYFDGGYTEEPAGTGTVRFHHRSTADLLNAAARTGFCLEHMVELGPSEDQIERIPVLGDQRHIPRLMGLRWRKPSGVG